LRTLWLRPEKRPDIDQETAKLKLQLERYTKPSYRGSEPEAVEKLVDEIEKFEKNRESLEESVKGYENILRGVTSNTLPGGPSIPPGVENPAANPQKASANRSKYGY
jgi:hypothetical protein